MADGCLRAPNSSAGSNTTCADHHHTLCCCPQAIFGVGNFTPSNGAGVLFRLVPDW